MRKIFFSFLSVYNRRKERNSESRKKARPRKDKMAWRVDGVWQDDKPVKMKNKIGLKADKGEL
jgi:hypothetical protein